MRGVARAYVPAVVLAVLACASLDAAAQSEPLRVTGSLPAQGYVQRDAAVTLELSRAPLASERMAVLFGTTDVTALFEAETRELRYRRGVLPLPAGERDLIVYVVDGVEWREVGRLPLRVAGALGIERAGVDPSLDVGVKSRLDAGYSPEGSAPERPTYRDVQAQLGVESEVVRAGGRAVTRATIFGTSERGAALRHRDLGEEAPRIDLSSYVVQYERQALRAGVGHITAGGQRHLINAFGSRGATLALAPSSRVQAAVAAQHGSAMVGWDDLLGVTTPAHRVLSGTIGLEALPRAGALRVELTALDGSILPRSGLNQGSVTDAEESRGLAVRVQAQTAGRRLRMDGGFSRSRFDNPPDALVTGGAALVPARPETRDARYLEASADVVRAAALGGGRTARLSVALAHERVDPLYRSVATYTRADFLQNRGELRADIAGVAVVGSRAAAENNLEDVPSILKTHTRRSTLDVAVPVGRVAGRSSTWWLPDVRYRLEHTHQFGAAVPAAGGFDPSHVPDQVTASHTAAADFRLGRATLRYQRRFALQDNRQPGREAADFETFEHTVAGSLRVMRTLTISADAGLTDASSLEREETDRTRRMALTLSWQPLRGSALELRAADTHASNAVREMTRDDRQLSAQWTSPLPGLERFGGKALLRWAHTASGQTDPRFQTPRRTSRFLDAGLNFRFF